MFHKYLKYKKKYLKLKKMIGGGEYDIIYDIIPEDTILFRCADNINDYNTSDLCKKNVRECIDTSKKGLYFANNILLSLSMILEYDKLLELGIFRVKKDIKLSIGKYSFRYINIKKYFDDNQKLILNMNVSPEENISHVQCNFQLLIKDKKTEKINVLIPKSNENKQLLESINFCEIFLVEDELNDIEMFGKYQINKNIIKNSDDLLNYLEKNNYPQKLTRYIDDNILIVKN
jgi:hypothetical protein